jgi:hypothetical protein
MSSNKMRIGLANKQGQLGFMSARGGLREGAGRKTIGVTKKISLTLPEELWERFEQQCLEHKASRSEVIRSIMESYYSK